MSGYLTWVMNAFNGSNGDETSRVFAELRKHGLAGDLAINLFRAKKASDRAKVYRGGDGRTSYKRMAYERKGWAMEQLCKALSEDADALGFTWGWQDDVAARQAGSPHCHVLYVDTPAGQISFHTDRQLSGPHYFAKWDGVRGMGGQRVIAFCASVLDGRKARGRNGETPK